MESDQASCFTSTYSFIWASRLHVMSTKPFFILIALQQSK